MKFTVLVTVLLALGVAHGFSFEMIKNHESRCSPDRWEGELFSWYPESNLMAYTNLSYDWKNHQISMDIYKAHTHNDNATRHDADGHERRSHHDGHYFKILLHFHKMKLYYIDHESGNCTVRPITHKMEKACVPGDHRHLATTSIADGIEIDVLMWKKEIHEKEVTIVYEVTKKMNIPISMKYSTPNHGGLTEFFEVTEGIEDETVFDAPEGCVEAPARHGRNVGAPLGRDMWENIYFM